MISHAAPERVLRPRRVDELADILRVAPDMPVMGGGTLAVPEWERCGAPAAIVHLPSIEALRTRAPNRWGASVTLADVLQDRQQPPALRRAAAEVGGPAVRNMATVGGNVAAAAPGCLAVVLLALGANATVLRRNDLRETTVPLTEVVGARDVLILAVSWPTTEAWTTHFGKVAVRRRGGPIVASVAVHADGTCRRIVVGGVGRPPRRLRDAEMAWRRGASLGAIAELAQREVAVVGDAAGTCSYRAAVVGTLVRRLVTATEEASAP